MEVIVNSFIGIIKKIKYQDIGYKKIELIKMMYL
jgi:hypothetical protein